MDSSFTTHESLDSSFNDLPLTQEEDVPPTPVRRTSAVWKHYKFLGSRGMCLIRLFMCSPVSNMFSILAYCKLCHKDYAYQSGGTGHLTRHYGKCSMKSNQLSLAPLDTAECEEALTKMIVAHAYPFAMSEHMFFKKFVKLLNPGFVIPNRKKVKDSCMKLYDQMYENMKQGFQMFDGKVSFTTDVWTSVNNDPYLVVTAHWIDESWVYSDRVIAFDYFPSPHTGQAIAQMLLKTFDDWNLQTKVRTSFVTILYFLYTNYLYRFCVLLWTMHLPTFPV